MRTCPKCGAENRQSATECRLCATPLGSPASAAPPQKVEAAPAEQLPPTQIVSDRLPAAAQAAQKICSACQTANEPDWLFCQSCGKKLSDTVQDSVPAGVASAKSDTAPQNLAGKEPSAPSVTPQKISGADRDTLKDLASRRPVEQDSPDRGASVPQAEAPPSENGGSNPRDATAPAAGVCPKCGATSTPTGFFCANCGTKLVPAGSPPPAVAPSGGHVLQLITEGGQIGGSYPVERGELLIGRNEGDVTFPHDGYLSSKHARIVEREGRFFLVDNGSRNGTFVRIKGEVEIEPGDTFLVGKQIFRLERS